MLELRRFFLDLGLLGARFGPLGLSGTEPGIKNYTPQGAWQEAFCRRSNGDEKSTRSRG